jgi:CheY-like chemotaxis protein
MHILLAEDNEGDVILTTETLYEINFPFTIAVVRDGWDAIRLLNKKDRYANERLPDMIILDLNLPKMNGIEVLVKIKANAATMHIPVMVLTTSTFEGDIKLCRQLNASCFITKPLEAADFSREVMHIAGLRDYLLQPAIQPGNTLMITDNNNMTVITNEKQTTLE